jgi:hypothetical protein
VVTGIALALTAAVLAAHPWIALDVQVRKTPIRPRSWPTSAFCSCIPTGMHGPTCIFWTILTPFSPQLGFAAMLFVAVALLEMRSAPGGLPPPGAVKRARSVLHRKSVSYGTFCMGAQGA